MMDDVSYIDAFYKIFVFENGIPLTLGRITTDYLIASMNHVQEINSSDYRLRRLMMKELHRRLMNVEI